MLFCLLAFLLAAPDANESIAIVKSFQNPLDVGDEDYLQFPYSFDFSRKNGRLYICDRYRSRVMVWNEDGSFHGGFLEKGQGPGQIFFPMKLAVGDEHVYIWLPTRQIEVFDLNMGHVKSIKIPGPQPRVFTPLSKEILLIGHPVLRPDAPNEMVVQKVDWEGKMEIVKRWETNFYLDIQPNKMKVKAFGPEIDIQHDDNGVIYIGFSEDKKIYKVGARGSITGELTFDIPVGPPTPMEREIVEEAWFLRPDGNTLNLVDTPGIDIDFDHDKAPWTHFLIKGDKILFVQTMLGSHVGLGNGFAQGSYVIADLATGKIEGQGKFSYTDTSQVLFRNGRILGLLVDDEDELQVHELAIKGFNG